MAADATRRWADLSKSQRNLLIAAAGAELALKITALVDISRRPRRGSAVPRRCGAPLWRST